MRDLKDSAKKLLDLMNNFTKEASYKIKNQTINWTWQKPKHLEKNVIKKMNNLYNENIKALTKDLKKIAEDGESSCSMITIV